LGDQGRIEVGGPANLVVVDPGAEWTVDPAAFRSRSRNTPFTGMRLRGKVLWTLHRGVVTYCSEPLGALA
jgi:dihydroorotase